MFICQAVALLHDIADEKLNFSPEQGWQKLNTFLAQQQLPKALEKEIVDIISPLSYKGGKEPAMKTLEGQIVQDADRLDALGAIGIARTMAYSGSVGRLIHDLNQSPRMSMTAEEYRNHQGTAINQFYEKLLQLKDLKKTDSVKEMAQERHQYMEEFLDRFYKEWEGKV